MNDTNQIEILDSECPGSRVHIFIDNPVEDSIDGN